MAVQLGHRPETALGLPADGTPAITVSAGQPREAREPGGRGRGLRRRVLAGWPLMGVLVVQAALSR